MKDFVKKYGANQFSQNGEDGIIEEVLIRLGLFQGRAVEFGGHDGTFCSNTANLFINYGWRGKLIEGDEMLFGQMLNNKALPDGVDMENAFVTSENVNHLVGECDVLSIDIDGNDYNVWKAINKKPTVVVIEINSSYKPTDDAICIEGTAYKPMVELGIEKGYFLLCHTGNLIFVDAKYRKKFPEVKGDPIKEHQNYFNDSWL